MRKIRRGFSSFQLFFAKKLSRCKQTNSKIFGKKAESAAAKFLKKEKKLKILARNYRAGRLEIDIVAYDKQANCIVFVEVKSRGINRELDACRAAAEKRKRANIKKAAKAYMADIGCQSAGLSTRYDIVSVVHGKDGSVLSVRHFQNIGFIADKRGKRM